MLKPDNVPDGSVFKGYQDWVVQDIVFEPYNTVFRLERWEGPNGEYIIGKLPPDVVDVIGFVVRHFFLPSSLLRFA